MYEEILGGIMDGSNPEMKRLRRMLAASRAMDEPPSPAGNRQIAEAAGGIEGDMEITDVPPPTEPSAPDPTPAAAASPVVSPKPPIPEPAKIGMRFSFDPRSQKAQEYEGIVREYQGNRMAGEGNAGTYKDPDGLTRNLPQVYGQEGSPADPEEGPRTPDETAAELAKIDAQPGGMALRIKQRTLGYGLGYGPKNEARRAHYDQYVQRSRAEQEQRREAQRARVAARGGMLSGGGPMGSYDSPTPSAFKLGGVTVLKGLGRFRPADSMEAAEVDHKRAMADYARSRPEQSAHKSALDEMKFGLAQEKEKRLARQHQDYMGLRQRAQINGEALRKKAMEAMQSRDAAKMAESVNSIEQRMLQVAQILKMKMEKANEDGWFTNPDPARLDVAIDPKTKEAGNPVPGDWDMWKNSFKADYNLLRELGADGVLPEIDEVYQKIDKLGVG